MRRFAVVLVLAASILLVGCSSTSKQLVGTWKGDIITDKGSKGTLESGIKNFFGSLLGPMTLEFNADGKYKISLSLGSETGTYSVSGNEVRLTPDDKDQGSGNKKNDKPKTFILSSDGKSLQSKKEFDSDTVLELKKQP